MKDVVSPKIGPDPDFFNRLLAVIAHVRHVETDYDTLLGRGVDRYDARRRVQERIEQVLGDWEPWEPDVAE